MREYTGKQSIMDEALGDYIEYDFSLIEPDDHMLELYFKDELIATFSQNRVTFEIIRVSCANYLKSIARWN